MNKDFSWDKLKTEVSKYTDVAKIRQELHRITEEIKKFEVADSLSPSAKKKLQSFEKKYAELSRSITRTQRQVDRKLSKLMRKLLAKKKEAESALHLVRVAAEKGADDLKKASTTWAQKIVSGTKSKSKKRPTKKAAARKKPSTATSMRKTRKPKVD